MLPAVVDGKGRSNAAKKPSPVVAAHPGGEGGRHAGFGLVVGHRDVDVDAVALGRGASISWNQTDGPRPWGSTRSSSPSSRVPSTTRQNGRTFGVTSATPLANDPVQAA